MIKKKFITAKQSLFKWDCTKFRIQYYSWDKDRSKFSQSPRRWISYLWYLFKAIIVMYFFKNRIHYKYNWEVFGDTYQQIEVTMYNHYNRWEDHGYDWDELAVGKGILKGWSVFLYLNGN